MRRNRRNELLRVRSLLWEAADTIARLWPEQMSCRLRHWDRVEKNARVAARVAASEDGVARATLKGLQEERMLGWDE